MALTGEGQGTSGYYLRFLVAPLASAAGLGLGAWWRRRGFRVTAACLTVYALLFAAGISWVQALLFAGWLFKSGESTFYQWPAALPPLLGVPAALARLSVLAFPAVGAVLWGLGVLLVAVGLLSAWRGVRGLGPAAGGTAAVHA